MPSILEPFSKASLNLAASQLLKQTTSRCPVCKTLCPAEVWKVGERPARVYLRRTCAEHGETTVCISSDARFYWLSKGHPDNAKGSCCSGSNCCAADGGGIGTLGRNAAGRAGETFEKLSTCLALIEIVNSCNLSCPTCYADSPLGQGSKVDAVPLENLKARIQGVIDRKGGIEILQLSGGEPTLHPQFFELVEWVQNHEHIDYLLLNTNGVRLATDAAFAERLGKAFHYGGMQVYLQFDGVQEAGQRWLRGADLRATRQRAIEVCQQINLPLTLAMTVTPENLPHLWEAIEFGLKYPHIRGISFQPMFGNGRVPEANKSVQDNKSVVPRLNTADIILSAVEQSGGKLRYDDFTPLPCGDPNCATIGYLLKVMGQVRSVSDFVNFSQVQGFLQNRVRYRLEDLLQCGCESEPLGELLKKFELDERNTFRLFIKPFMDALDWDQDRIDRCCTHVIRPDGKLDSFCRYYSGFPDTKVSPQ